MKRTLIAYLELLRPANIITALADIMAGFAAAGGLITVSGYALRVSPESVGWLLLATCGLYGGGVVFNDLFDADLDAEERPERPIPSGRVSSREAAILGGTLIAAGIYFAFHVNGASGGIATAVALMALIYDRWAKHYRWLGPLLMGGCRGGNLLLGVSILPVALAEIWFLALIPVIYIAAITLISRGEVKGGSRVSGNISVVLMIVVLSALAVLSLRMDYAFLPALPFWLLFGVAVLPPFMRAARVPEPVRIRTAVQRGVLSLIILNSVLAAGFEGVVPGLLVLLLLPVSILLSKLFDVT